MRNRRPAPAVAAMTTLVIATVLSAGAAIAQSSPPGARERVLQHLEQASYIVPGRGLGGVRVGMPMQAVVDRWGNPFRGDRKGFFKRTTILLYKSGIDTWIRISGDRHVEEIGIQGRNQLTTPEGIGFGTPRNQVSMVYGRAAESSAGEAGYPDRGISFVFRSGSVYQIRIFQPRQQTGS